MPDRTRRALLSGAVGSALCAAASPVFARAPLRAPPVPMHLSRKLVRGLSDGNQIIVERTWEIRFRAHGSGWAIEGAQSAVVVDAPQRLEPIAAIERSRVTDDQFPILIGSDGQIIAAGEAERAADVERAVHVAEQMIASAGTSVSQQRRLKIYLGQIQASGSSLLDRLPRDLFFPRSPGFTDRRPVSLPNGEVGEFLVEYVVHAQPDSGLLDRADRRIVTRLADTEQASFEHWELRVI